jgi:hypothetical protein
MIGWKYSRFKVGGKVLSLEVLGGFCGIRVNEYKNGGKVLQSNKRGGKRYGGCVTRGKKGGIFKINKLRGFWYR